MTSLQLKKLNNLLTNIKVLEDSVSISYEVFPSSVTITIVSPRSVLPINRLKRKFLKAKNVKTTSYGKKLFLDFNKSVLSSD